MFSRWSRKSKIPDRAQQLISALNDYPSFPVPAKGEPISLTPEQTSQNLEAFLKVMPSRLETLKDLIKAFGIIWPDHLTLESSKDLITQLHAWAGDTWKYTLKDTAKDTETHWFVGERNGEYKILSIVSDIALLLGTVIIHERPELHWGIDTDKDNLNDRMVSANRVVLLAPWRGDSGVVIPVDVEWVVLGRLVYPDDSSERFENNWLRLVEDASHGGYEGVGITDA